MADLNEKQIECHYTKITDGFSSSWLRVTMGRAEHLDFEKVSFEIVYIDSGSEKCVEQINFWLIEISI